MIRRPHTSNPVRRLALALLVAAGGAWLALPSRAEGPGPVQTQADYDAWLRQQSQPAAPIPAPPASAATPPPSALLTPTRS